MHLQSLSRVCLTGFLMLSIPQTLMAATGTIGRYLIPDTGPLVWQQAGTVGIDIATTFVAGYDGNSFLLRKSTGGLMQWKMSVTGTVTKKSLVWSGKGVDVYPVVGYAQGRFLTWNNLNDSVVRWNIDPSTSAITMQKVGTISRSCVIEGFDGDSLVFRNLTSNKLTAWFLNPATGAPSVKKTFGTLKTTSKVVDYMNHRLVANNVSNFSCWTISPTAATINKTLGTFDGTLMSEVGFDGTRLTLQYKTTKILYQWTINPDYTITKVKRSAISLNPWSPHGGRLATGYAGTTLAATKGFETQSGSKIISGKVEDNALASMNVAVDLYRVTNGTAVKVAARKTDSGGRFQFPTAPLAPLTEYEVRVAGTP